jgi:hypothetical protein
VPVFTFIGGSTAALVWWHHDVHHTLNAVQASIALFCAVNVFVALSEMTLYFHSDDIRRDWKRNEAKLGVGKLPPVYLFQKVPLAELFTSYHWCAAAAAAARVPSSSRRARHNAAVPVP